MGRRLPWAAVALAAASCVYFNAMYDAKQDFERAIERERQGREQEARVHYDSVIAITGRILLDHPESEHAAPAALLKARSEIATRRWESAVVSAAAVPALTRDSSLIVAAAGLEGIARRERAEGDDLEEAERLLTRALEGGPVSEDSALFLFHRGLTRLDAGQVEAAAADLEAVGAQEQLTPEVRLDLARGLARVGQFDEALQLTTDLLRESRYANFGSGMDAHLDSLAHWAPARLETAMARLLETPDMTGTKLALLHYYRGLSREMSGDSTGALAEYDTARRDAGQGRYAAEAAYRWALVRMHVAERPADITETRQAVAAGRNVPDPEVAARANELSLEVREFSDLMDAVRTRGSTAAEAALRAAEIAGADLGARRVARGLYLQYLSLAPESPWRAKAIAGALAYADARAGDWAGDQGSSTDARLRNELSGLPANDPYRVSIQNLARNAAIDSAYVDAERDLHRRLVEIRMLYDTTAVLVQPGDTAAAGQADDEAVSDEAERERPEI